MRRKEPLMMNEAERKLFDATKEFVAKTCPKLSDADRAPVVARVYSAMHFITSRVGEG